MRNFASYLCLLGLFSFGFFVESVEGHGDRTGETELVSETFAGCVRPSRTRLSQQWRVKYTTICHPPTVLKTEPEGDRSRLSANVHLVNYSSGGSRGLSVFPAIIRTNESNGVRLDNSGFLAAEQCDRHWHYETRTKIVGYGESGYDTSCNTEREHCWYELSERLKDYCIANNSLEESRCDASNAPYTRKEKEYNVIYYYHDVSVKKCRTELVLP